VVMEGGGEVMVTRQMPMLVRTRMIILYVYSLICFGLFWFCISYDAACL